MQNRIFTGSLRQRLLTPTAVILALCVSGLSVLLVFAQRGQLNTLRDSVLSSIKQSNEETKNTFTTMSEQVSVSLGHMSGTTCESIAQVTRKGLQQQKSELEKDLEDALRKNASSIAELLSQVAPRAILANDFLDLVNYTKSASGNPDIVFAVFLKPDGSPLTRYIDRQDPSIKEYIRTGEGKTSIEKAINASRKDKSVFFVEQPVLLEGQSLGDVLLCVSRESSTSKINAMESRFAALIDNNKKEVKTVIEAESEKVSEKMRQMLSEVDAKNVAAAEAIGETINNSCDSITTNVEQISAGVGGASIAAVFVILFFVITRISKQIGRLVSELSGSAEGVAASSGLISSSSESLASWATQQASSIQQTSASLEEMSAMTQQNAQDAVEVNDLMKHARSIVKSANDSMKQLTSSMDDIRQASEKTQKIVKTIDEIAFQTNLLALNAAVEAARAGEAGAGFAVVANEVRNLATRAAEAARNTAQLIEGTVRLVGDGSSIVKRTNEEFAEVEKSTVNVGGLIDSITTGSNENAQGIEQLTTTAADMDKVTQQTAASAEESASASQEMFGQAAQMRSIVGELVALVGGKCTADRDDEQPLHLGGRALRSADADRSLAEPDVSRQSAVGPDEEEDETFQYTVSSETGMETCQPSSEAL